MTLRSLASALVAMALSAPLAAQQPVVLRLASPAPAGSYLHPDAFTPWAAAVSQASGGKLWVETFYGGKLGNFAVAYDRVLDGTAGIGFILTSFVPGKFRQLDVVTLPFEARSALAASTALWNVYEKGVTAAEFDQVKPLAIWTFPNAGLHSRTPIRSLDDLRGRKIATSTPIAGKMALALGGVQVAYRPDQAYQAISRGLADASLMPFTSMAAFRVHEIVRHHVDVALGGEAALLVMPRKKYESLPEQARAAIDRFSYLSFSQKLGRLTDDQAADKRALVKDSVHTLPSQEEARWKKRVEEIAGDFVRNTPDGARVLSTYRAEVAAHERTVRAGL
jgi:TRAP-type C4-dicarboxylate transport system substrate-binding protein